MIVEVIGEIVMPRMLALIIDYGTDASVEKPAFLQKIFEQNNGPFIVAVMAAMIFTAVLMMLSGVGGAYFGARASVGFASDLRCDVYKKVQKFSFANLDKFSTGSLVTRLTNDITQMQNFINMLLRMCLRAPGMLVGALIMAIILNPKLTLVLCVSIPLLLLSIMVFVKKGFSRFGVMQTKVDSLNSTVQENITNVRVVKSFVREDYEKKKFRKSNGDLKRAGMGAMMMMILMSQS